MYNGNVLNRIFIVNNFKNNYEYQFFNNSYSDAVRWFVKNPERKTNRAIISLLYDYLKNNYQNEYYYKNTLLNKQLLTIHSTRTATALSEIYVKKSKADFVLINGIAEVFEIKTGLDTYNRLNTQLNDYYKAFMYVSVLTDEKNLEELQKRLEKTDTGISILTKDSKIKVIKKPNRNEKKIKKDVLFSILNKKEYERIIKDLYGKLPKNDINEYKKCKSLFCKCDVKTLYPLFLRELKKRNKIIEKEYNQIPYELKSLVYFGNYSNRNYKKLNNFLEMKYRG